MSARVLVVLCAFPDSELARRVARRMIEESLAACAQLPSVPMQSIYRWEGELCEESEQMLVLKTSLGAWPRLRQRLSELHPYELPEILALPALGNEGYLRWVEESCPPVAAHPDSPEQGLEP